MASIPVKFKMTPEQYSMLYSEFQQNNDKPDTTYFLSFQEFLDWKFSDLINKKIDEVINAEQCK